jgi:hypothetical protein
MAGKSVRYYCLVICLLLINVSLCNAYMVYLKNGKFFDAIEHRVVDDIFIIKLRNGNEVGFPVDDIDMSKTDPSIKAYYEQKKREEEALKRRKEFEEKEKDKPKEFIEFFTYEKRGMQLNFNEEEITKLIEFGERNYTYQKEFLKAYSFYEDYMPSVIYTKRLRLILYGVEKAKTKKPINNNEIRGIIEDPTLLLLLVVTADSPDFLSGAYVYLKQDSSEIIPFHLKVSDIGERTIYWPESPAYYWKILVQFKYDDIDLKKEAVLVLKKGVFQRTYKIDFNHYR